ncbi:MAG: carboxymuconolactone decarboxylase family protein [Pseudomonadota bacterium]
MAKFDVHAADTAPEASRPLLETSVKAFGRVPNLHGVMAESPALLEGYQRLHTLFQEGTAFDKDELTVIWQAINVEHSCHYCVPAHTMIAKMMKVDDAVTTALRDETPLPNAKLEALRTFTLTVVRNRGVVGDADVQAFLDVGYQRRHILDVVLGVAQKVMSNYVNHLAETPIDPPFQAHAWEKKATAA